MAQKICLILAMTLGLTSASGAGVGLLAAGPKAIGFAGPLGFADPLGYAGFGTAGLGLGWAGGYGLARPAIATGLVGPAVAAAPAIGLAGPGAIGLAGPGAIGLAGPAAIATGAVGLAGPVGIAGPAAIATGPAVLNTGAVGLVGGTNVVPAAVLSNHQVGVYDVPTTGLIQPITIDVPANVLPVNFVFRSASSQINVAHNHEGAKGSLKETVSEDEPHILKHTVTKPILQEVREVISPFRRIMQTVEPVREEVQTLVARGVGSAVGVNGAAATGLALAGPAGLAIGGLGLGGAGLVRGAALAAPLAVAGPAAGVLRQDLGAVALGGAGLLRADLGGYALGGGYLKGAALAAGPIGLAGPAAIAAGPIGLAGPAAIAAAPVAAVAAAPAAIAPAMYKGGAVATGYGLAGKAMMAGKLW